MTTVRQFVKRWLKEPEQAAACDSRDDHPWDHPFLTRANIARFRDYSDGVWDFAMERARNQEGRLRCAFAVNMAQNMYKWARLAQKYGVDSTLFLHPMDGTAISKPEWEEFDGEYGDVLDGEGFLKGSGCGKPEVAVREIAIQSDAFLQAYGASVAGNSRPLLKLLACHSQVRLEVLEKNPAFLSYFDWAAELSRFPVIYAASAPFAAYASGRPYCLFSVGGDLQFDCGRGDAYGRTMRMAFNSGRFLLVSNPHTLGHSRRLGLTNGVYLPYPMDTERYCPGHGEARRAWEAEYGPGVYVLSSSRLDVGVKGHGEKMFETLVRAAAKCPEIRFVFLAWGHSAEEFGRRIEAQGLQRHFIMLPPVGKKRLIDYYRSCDLVLDQFIFGYYGATALEAAAVGKPVVMKLRGEQYAALYRGDVAPVVNVSTPEEIFDGLVRLCAGGEERKRAGEAMREWVVRTHGEEQTVPVMRALLWLAADGAELPDGLRNPLLDSESEEEMAYHRSCEVLS